LPNNRINSDWQFRCAPLPAGYAERWRGRFAPRHRAADSHPLSVRRFAPGHQAVAADSRPREQARVSVSR